MIVIRNKKNKPRPRRNRQTDYRSVFSIVVSSILLLVAPVLLGADDADEDPLQRVRRASSYSGAVDALVAVEQALDQDEAVAAYRFIAALAEMAGDYGSAAEYYTRAFDLGDELSGLKSALVWYELGRFADAEERARIVVFGSDDYAIRRRATATVARCMAATGRLSEAVGLLATVASIDEAEHLEPEILLLLYRLAMANGDEDIAGEALRKLQSLFPESIARLLVDPSGPVARGALSLPDLLIEEPLSELSLPQVEIDGSQQGTTNEEGAATGIQTGSFRDQENAEYMARDLRALGFSVVILHSSDVPDLFRVVVGTEGSESMQELLLRLKSRGIEGFLVF